MSADPDKLDPQKRDAMTSDDDFKDVCCPHCESDDITLISLFGSSVSEVMFRCLACHTFFNWMKWQGRLPASPALEDGDDETAGLAATEPHGARH